MNAKIKWVSTELPVCKNDTSSNNGGTLSKNIFKTFIVQVLMIYFYVACYFCLTISDEL